MRKVDPKLYGHNYFKENCIDFECFKNFNGTKLSSRLSKAYSFAQLKEGAVTLDFGCGRGELAIYIAMHGFICHAIDYSSDALTLIKMKAAEINNFPANRLFLYQSEDLELRGFPTNYFDAVFMIDIYEHLYPEQIDILLSAIYRTLKPNGVLIIHTHPNLYLSRIASKLFPRTFFRKTLFQVLAKLSGIREVNVDHFAMHVNEQTPKSLRKSLEQAGYDLKVWTTQFHSLGEILVPRIFLKKMFFHGFPITSIPIIRDYFNNNIWAIAKRSEVVNKID